VLLVKHVAALPGQSVCRNWLTVSVDAVTIGEARERDSRGCPLPSWQGCCVIAVGEVFLMSAQSADSLDGRYFGPLYAVSIVSRAIPLWTHRTAEEE
jgi:type IV secretory pathway protease TraF